MSVVVIPYSFHPTPKVLSQFSNSLPSTKESLQMTLPVCIQICQKHLASVHFFLLISAVLSLLVNVFSVLLPSFAFNTPHFPFWFSNTSSSSSQSWFLLTCAFPLVSKPSDSTMARPISFSTFSTSFSPSFPIFLSLLVYSPMIISISSSSSICTLPKSNQ